jgi:hypothetical protein
MTTFYNSSYLLNCKYELLFFNQMFHSQLIPLLLLRFEELTKRPFERRGRLDHGNGAEALVRVLVQQVRLPIHQVVLETLRGFRLNGEKILSSLLHLKKRFNINFTHPYMTYETNIRLSRTEV